jgi:hypothetical protein
MILFSSISLYFFNDRNHGKKDIDNLLSHSIPAQKVSTLIMNEPSARKSGLGEDVAIPPRQVIILPYPSPEESP